MEEKETVLEEVAEEAVETAEAEAASEDKKSAKKDKKAENKKHKAELDKLSAELENEKAKTAAAEDKYLRVVAEYDNYRRRTQKEKEGIYSDAKADAVKELLPLIDNLQRATGYTEADKVAEGVSMILGTLPDVLGKMGIEAYGEPGEQFDPNIHNALMHEDNPELGENVIVSVYQQGYRVGDKIIRYAMVTVAN